ncbi:MAG TPA: hypothetical protein ENF80_03475 [Thermofilum sp.]|nr:hypothetical protein [Thermofilum sp.]
MSLGIRTEDWKNEKHVPVIDAPDSVKKGENVKVVVSVGKAIPHPNTPEHHIKWIQLYFLPEGSSVPFMVGRVEFDAHGEADLYNEFSSTFTFKLGKSGKLISLSFCNIHGLWSYEKEIKVIE